MNAFRRFAMLAGAAAAGAMAACSGPEGPVRGDLARAHAAVLVSHNPRTPGSPGSLAAGDYLLAEVRKLGLPAHEDRWEESVEVYGKPRQVQLRNLWTVIPGADPKAGPIVLLAAHYDSKDTQNHPDPQHIHPFGAALDAAGSCGVLLELARVLVADTRPRTANVWIAWFDGEECLEYEWPAPAERNGKSLLGSWRMVRQLGADKQAFPNGLQSRLVAMVLLDLLGDPNLKIDRDTRSVPVLLDIFRETAEALGDGDRMYRWNSPMTDDHVPFREYGINVVDLIDFRWRFEGDSLRREHNGTPADVGPAPPPDLYTKWWHTELDNMDHLSAESLAWVGNLVWHALPRIEARLCGE
jgi:hypothetical protein